MVSDLARCLVSPPRLSEKLSIFLYQFSRPFLPLPPTLAARGCRAPSRVSFPLFSMTCPLGVLRLAEVLPLTTPPLHFSLEPHSRIPASPPSYVETFIRRHLSTPFMNEEPAVRRVKLFLTPRRTKMFFFRTSPRIFSHRYPFRHTFWAVLYPPLSTLREHTAYVSPPFDSSML